MTSPALIANPEAAAASHQSRESKRKKRRKLGLDESTARPESASDPSRWRSESEQRIYATKLVDALSHIRRENSSPASVGRVVRETAYGVLAVAAKGRNRWSREILTRRLSLRVSQINKRRKHKKARIRGDNRVKKPAVKKPAVKKRLPPLQRKVRFLSRLVPGCRKVSFPSLLDETTDYIAALQMQVRTMTMISELLTSAGGNGNDNDNGVGSSQS